MKHLRSFNLLLSIFSITSLLASPIFTYAQVVVEGTPSEEPMAAFVEDFGEPKEVIVQYKDSEEIAIIEVPEDTPIEEVIEAIEDNPAVEYAEPNFTRKLFDLGINDPQANLLWGHEIIDLGDAWRQLSTGLEDITVAVIDTGVLYTHPDLNASMWDSSSCLNENGTTTTCAYGYDIVHNDSDPLPDSFHGTHVSGIIAAVRNNNLGLAGVAPLLNSSSQNTFIGGGQSTINISTPPPVQTPVSVPPTSPPKTSPVRKLLNSNNTKATSPPIIATTTIVAVATSSAVI
ncbi:MAG: S8 family serine peptidase [Patescibacteria group bacterium]